MSGFDWGGAVPEHRKIEVREQASAASQQEREKKRSIEQNPDLKRLNSALEEANNLRSYSTLEETHREVGVESFLQSLAPLAAEGTIKIDKKNLTAGSLDIEISFVGPDGFEEVATLRSVVDELVKEDMGPKFRTAKLHELDEMYKGMGYKVRKEYIASLEDKMQVVGKGGEESQADQAGMFQLKVFAGNESSSVYIYDQKSAQDALATIARNATPGAFAGPTKELN